MKVRKSLIVSGLLVASALPIGWALAQAGPPPDMGQDMMGPGGMMGYGMGRHGGRHGDREGRNMTPEIRARMLDGRIAGAKAALKLDENQQKLFAPVEAQMRANAAARDKRMEEFRAAFEARRAEASKQDQSKAPARPSIADRMERRAAMMSESAERMKAFAAAFKPFYDSLNDEQKALVGMLLPGEGRMGRGHHRGWAMGFGHGRGPGMGPGMMGPGNGPGMGPGMGPGVGPGPGPGAQPTPPPAKQ